MKLSPLPKPGAYVAGCLLWCALFITTPGVSSGADTASSPASTAQPFQPYTNEQLRTTFEKTAQQLLVPGAVLLLRTPAGEFTATYGVAEMGSTRPVRLDDHIRVGSNTKTWTATVILQLVQEGRIQLNDPVAKYRPDVPNGDKITIEQLLSMRSGLFNYSETRKLNQLLDEQPGKIWRQDELLALAWAHPAYFPPGQGFHYSNTNYVLLGLIAERVDRKPLAAIFQDRLFKPLGLKSTSFPDTTSPVIPSPHPQGYMYSTNLLTIDSSALPAPLLAAARAGKLRPNNYTNSNPSWGWAAGAGISTAADLATWVEAMNSGKLLNADMQKLRMNSLQPRSAGDTGARYGLGIAQFNTFYGHTGELPGFNSFMANDPVKQITLIVWTNLAPAPDGQDPATTIARKLIEQIYRAAGTAAPAPTGE